MVGNALGELVPGPLPGQVPFPPRGWIQSPSSEKEHHNREQRDETLDEVHKKRNQNKCRQLTTWPRHFLLFSPPSPPLYKPTQTDVKNIYAYDRTDFFESRYLEAYRQRRRERHQSFVGNGEYVGAKAVNWNAMWWQQVHIVYVLMYICASIRNQFSFCHSRAFLSNQNRIFSLAGPHSIHKDPILLSVHDGNWQEEHVRSSRKCISKESFTYPGSSLELVAGPRWIWMSMNCAAFFVYNSSRTPRLHCPPPLYLISYRYIFYTSTGNSLITQTHVSLGYFL